MNKTEKPDNTVLGRLSRLLEMGDEQQEAYLKFRRCKCLMCIFPNYKLMLMETAMFQEELYHVLNQVYETIDDTVVSDIKRNILLGLLEPIIEAIKSEDGV